MTSMAVQTPDSIPWWSGNAQLTNLSGRLLGAHVVHAGLIVLWTVKVFVPDAEPQIHTENFVFQRKRTLGFKTICMYL